MIIVIIIITIIIRYINAQLVLKFDMSLYWFICNIFRCVKYDNVPVSCTFVPDPKDPSCCRVPSCQGTSGTGTSGTGVPQGFTGSFVGYGRPPNIDPSTLATTGYRSKLTALLEETTFVQFRVLYLNRNVRKCTNEKSNQHAHVLSLISLICIPQSRHFLFKKGLINWYMVLIPSNNVTSDSL